MKRSAWAGALVVLGCASFPDLDERDMLPTPRHGVVLTEEQVASEVGRNVLDAGGNAVDAAVAAAFALAVTFPEAGNLGGGGFALFVPHDPAREPLAVDFRETAPAALQASAFFDAQGKLDRARALDSAFSVGVPGTVAGLWLLHREAGSLPWRDVVEPAIRHARFGMVGASLQWRLKQPGVRERIEKGGGAEVYFPGGDVPSQSAPLHQLALADALQRIADRGPEGFYRGETADAIVAEIERRGGVLAHADLERYDAELREPLRGWFRGKEILTMPPPSSGGVVLLQALSILEGFPLDQERERTLAARGDASSAEALSEAARAGISARAVHWWIEALRCAFADRAEHMGDPDAWPVPVDELLSPAWIAERRISIGERANPGVGPMTDRGTSKAASEASDGGPQSAEPRPAPSEGSETTHLVVIDAAGNAVSLTTSLNSGFGSAIYVRDAGIFLNNTMDDFALQPGAPNQFGLVGGEANALAPGKRPLSSMTPVVVRDGGNAVTMLLGARGGPHIITSVFLTILRTEVYGETLAEAQRAPRLHQQWNPAATLIEPGWDASLLQGLENRGHLLEPTTAAGAGLQAIRLRIGGEPEAVADPRTPMATAAPQGRDATTSRHEHRAADARWARALRLPGRDLDWQALQLEPSAGGP